MWRSTRIQLANFQFRLVLQLLVPVLEGAYLLTLHSALMIYLYYRESPRKDEAYHKNLSNSVCSQNESLEQRPATLLHCCLSAPHDDMQVERDYERISR